MSTSEADLGSVTAASRRAQMLDAKIDELTLSAAHATDRAPPSRTFRRILAPITSDSSSDKVLAWASELGRLFDADVTIFHALDPAPELSIYPALGPIGFGAPGVFPARDIASLEASADAALRQAREQMERDVRAVATLRREGPPGREIVRAVEELDCDLVILGPESGGAIERAVLGSVADHVKNHARTNVLLARTLPAPGPVLAAVDGTTESRRAAHLADALASRWHTLTSLLYVAPDRLHTTYDEELAAWQRARALAPRRSADEPIRAEIEFGVPSNAIVEHAQALAPALVAMGTHAGGFQRLMGASVSDRVAHEALVNLLVVHSPSDQRP